MYRALVVAILLGIALCACSGLPGAANVSTAPSGNARELASPSPNPRATALLFFSKTNAGVHPSSDLTLVDGRLYGTTLGSLGYNCNCGTVYAITPQGNVSLLHDFNRRSDGLHPSGDLTYVDSIFYGVTANGGDCGVPGQKSDGCGTIYSITKAGNERVVYAFLKSTGGSPSGTLAYSNGKLYGVTEYGGYGRGTVWSFDLSTGTLKTLHVFPQGSDAYPEAGLTLVGSTLYGTISGDYNGYECAFDRADCGALFSIRTNGDDYTLLRMFDGADGATPESSLTEAGDVLYGTTTFGGVGCEREGGCGTIFSIDSSGRFTSLFKFAANGTQGTQPAGRLFAAGGILYGTTTFGGQVCAKIVFGCGTIYEFHIASKHERVIYRFDGSIGAVPTEGVTRVGSAIYGVTYGSRNHDRGLMYRYRL